MRFVHITGVGKMTIYGVDAFTAELFKGNPACVCILDGNRDSAWMQNVAAEMNLSETAFLAGSGSRWDLRWFTPVVEVDLCGHATLASAHVLWETGESEREGIISFDTKSGRLEARRIGGWIDLDFPAEPPQETTPPDRLLEALGTEALWVGKNRFDYLVEIDSEEELRKMKPDFNLLSAVQTRGVIVTSRSSCREYDFVSRFFAPAAGVLEDPVTGSAHCCLGPFWKEKTGSFEFTAYQVSERGGLLKLRVGVKRVHIGGRAVTVWRGEIA
jgi:predicted PhzF superfamily epimerase YddE/YHI9